MLRQRLISGFLMGGLAVGSVFLLPAGAEPLILLPIALIAILEFYAMLDASHLPHFKVVGTIGGLGMILLTWLSGRGLLGIEGNIDAMALFAVVAVCFLRQLFHVGKENAWETTAGTLLGVVYVAFLMTFMVKLLGEWGTAQGRYLILFLVVAVKMTDIGAFFTGCSIGRHKLIPRVSPGKTWEGCIGGVLAGVAGGLVISHFYGKMPGVTPFGTTATVIVSLVLAVFGILGDLVESLFKRAAGVKDSGHFIKGMGGILDVLDSLLFTAPVLYSAARILS